MMKAHVVIPLVAAVCLVHSALADPAPPAMAPKILGLKGTCSLFRIGRRADTTACKGFVLNTVVNGFVDFVFFDAKDGDDAMLTFSGRGRQTKPDDNTSVQPIDRILFTDNDKADPPLTAAGTCRYTNPYRGAATVDCEAKAGDGHEFEAHFTSDGSPPTTDIP